MVNSTRMRHALSDDSSASVDNSADAFASSWLPDSRMRQVAVELLFPLTSIPDMGLGGSISALKLRDAAHAALQTELPELAQRGSIVTGHLCEAPGGFVQELRRSFTALGVEHTWWTVSETDKFSFPLDLIASGLILNRDVCRPGTQKRIRCSAPFPTRVMTTDHSAPTEAALGGLLGRQVDIVLRTLHVGGLCILRIVGLSTVDSQQALLRLYQGFRSVEVVQSALESPLTEELFVVCAGKLAVADGRRTMAAVHGAREAVARFRRDAQVQVQEMCTNLAGIQPAELEHLITSCRQESSFRCAVSAFLKRHRAGAQAAEGF